MIKSMLLSMAESKVFSGQLFTQATSATGTVVVLSQPIVEGDDINQRSGTKITPISMDFKFRFVALVASQSCRVLVFQDLFAQATAPSVVDILPSTTWISHFSDIRQVQQQRFRILLDETVDCSLSGESIKHINTKIRKMSPVYYDASTNINGANGKGSIFMIVIGSAVTGTWDFDYQLDYKDI
jgi:hypothetical protein